MLLNSSNLLDLPVGHPVSLVLQVAESPGKVINELRSPWRGNRSNSSQNDLSGEQQRDLEEKGWKMSKNPSPELTSELQWAVAVNVDFLCGTKVYLQWDFCQECLVPAALSWCIPPSRACTPVGMLGNGW